jgi:RNA polymerase sigma factor (sigma-70 family)
MARRITPVPQQDTVIAMRADPDHARFLALLGSHKKILYKVAYTYCKSSEDRRDLVQEMAAQLWKSFASFNGSVQFSTWMYKVAMNVAISHFRSEARRLRDTLPIEEYGLDIASVDQVFSGDSDNMRILHQLIGELDELNRALILLFLEGFSQEEIADTVGITVTNVATRLSRIKQVLQRGFDALTTEGPRP